MEIPLSNHEDRPNVEGLEENIRYESKPLAAAKPFFNDASFQNVPTLLLKDLNREGANGDRLLELQDIAVYALLKSHARSKGNCFPSYARLAKLAGSSVSTIQRSMKRLEDAGHIQRKNHNKGKIYILTDVAADSKIVRRNRVAVTPRPREICPPEFRDVIRDASLDFSESKISDKAPLEHLPPIVGDDPPITDGESPF